MYKNTIALVAGLLLAAGSAFAADAPAAASTAAQAAPAAAAPAKAAATGSVAKSQFTTGVENHEPKDNIDSLTNDQTRIYFWATLDNLQGQEVTFRWSYNDVDQGDWKTTPKAGRWRTVSSKELDPSKLGTWKVEVLDASGNVLTSKTFEYKKADASAAPAAATK